MPDLRPMPWQDPGVRELHQELRNVVGAHCGCWVGVDVMQTARGLVVTPYPLCRMSLGVHLRARPSHAPAARYEPHCKPEPVAWIGAPPRV